MTKSEAGGGPLKLKPFYTIKELALRWDVSARHIHREVDSGALQVHRFGRSIRVSAEAVAVYEATHKT